MPKHYLVRRSRLGRFNFTLLAENGRVTGVVTVSTEKRSKAEIEQAAREKIRALVVELAAAAEGPGSGEPSGPTEA